MILIVVGVLAVAGGIYWWQKYAINSLILGRKDYLPSIDQEECKTLTEIMCANGYVSFSDNLGCGCKKEGILSTFKFIPR